MCNLKHFFQLAGPEPAESVFDACPRFSLRFYDERERTSFFRRTYRQTRRLLIEETRREADVNSRAAKFAGEQGLYDVLAVRRSRV